MRLFVLWVCLILWQPLLAMADVVNDGSEGPGQNLHAPVGLAEALRAVMAYNPSVKGKRAELTAQEHAVSTAKSGMLPTFSVHGDTLSPGFDRGTFRVQQPLWAFGKIDTDIKIAKAQVTVERWGVRQVELQLLEKTAAAYAKVVGCMERMEVAESNIEEHEALYLQMKRRRSGQLSSAADERLALSRLIQAKSRRLRIEGEAQAAMAELRALTQVSVDVQDGDRCDWLVLPPDSDIEVYALKVSAEVAVKRQRIDVARLAIKKTKVASFPTLYGRLEQEFLDTPSSGKDTRAGFVIEGTLEGVGFAAWGRVKNAGARLVAARQDMSVSVNNVRTRMRTLMVNKGMQERLLKSQGEAVTVVEETLDSFMRQYQSGRKSWLDVLNTQRELAELRFQQVQIRNDWYTLSLRIATLTGGLDRLAGVETI